MTTAKAAEPTPETGDPDADDTTDGNKKATESHATTAPKSTNTNQPVPGPCANPCSGAASISAPARTEPSTSSGYELDDVWEVEYSRVPVMGQTQNVPQHLE